MKAVELVAWGEALGVTSRAWPLSEAVGWRFPGLCGLGLVGLKTFTTSWFESVPSSATLPTRSWSFSSRQPLESLPQPPAILRKQSLMPARRWVEMRKGDLSTSTRPGRLTVRSLTLMMTSFGQESATKTRITGLRMVWSRRDDG